MFVQQYYYVGKSNSNISSSYKGWIDLFCWSTGNDPTNVNTYKGDYSTFVDWGVNPITNGGNQANKWRTLSKNEWVYLFYGRTNAATKFGLGSVNGVNGAILLPDNWTIPSEVSFIASTTQGLADQGTYYSDDNNRHFTDNTYTTAQWMTMEGNGAVFLPAAGDRIGVAVGSCGSDGFYWSSTLNDEHNEYFLFINSWNLSPQETTNRFFGQSVRLVRDVE